MTWIINKILERLKKARAAEHHRPGGKMQREEAYRRWFILDTIIKALED